MESIEFMYGRDWGGGGIFEYSEFERRISPLARGGGRWNKITGHGGVKAKKFGM